MAFLKKRLLGKLGPEIDLLGMFEQPKEVVIQKKVPDGSLK